MELQYSSKAAGPTNMAKSRPRATPPRRDPPAHLHSILGVTGLVHTALAHGVGADADVLTNLIAVRKEDVVPMQLLQREVGWGPGQDLATLGCVGVQLGLAAELEAPLPGLMAWVVSGVGADEDMCVCKVWSQDKAHSPVGWGEGGALLYIRLLLKSAEYSLCLAPHKPRSMGRAQGSPQRGRPALRLPARWGAQRPCASPAGRGPGSDSKPRS